MHSRDLYLLNVLPFALHIKHSTLLPRQAHDGIREAVLLPLVRSFHSFVLVQRFTYDLSAIPLDDVREDWLSFLDASDEWPPKDGEWRINPPGYPVPTKPVEDIVTISEKDGKHWSDWVCVGPEWGEDWVSPPWSVRDSPGYELADD
jgi:hypothetical protein